jgi:D-erythronate 2-dehydrogenase
LTILFANDHDKRARRLSMRILITGAAGMLGRKLINQIAKDANLNSQAVVHVDRHDVVLCGPPPEAGFSFGTYMSDLSDPGQAEKLLLDRPDVIFHLAAVVSGEAETDFDKGYRVNFDGTRALLEAVRKTGHHYRPKFIFTSSIAVFGRPFPDVIPDDFFNTPLTSYGAQKAACELLLADYSRKGFIDGVGLRMPTVCVRPGKPNLAASGFFSNIIREPLAGKEAILPVGEDVRHWHISPRRAIGLLLHACTLKQGDLAGRPTLSMPGLSCTVAEQIASLSAIAGADTVNLIKRVPDDKIMKIVEGWPQNFTAARARALGFTCDLSFDEIIRIHLEDDVVPKNSPTH